MNNFNPREAVFYHIYPLGFCDAPRKNEATVPTNRIEKITKWIPHMKSLGINALYLGPVFESGTHGYDTHDFRLIDKRLGSNEDFKALCKALREADIHLILDGVFNHVGRGFFAFEDVLRNRENSPYCDWISGLRFDRNNRYGDGLSYDNWGGHDLLVKLNLKNPQVREYLLSAVDMWIDEFSVEGLRLDAADCIDHDFFRELRRRTEKKNPHFWLMGEITDASDYRVWMNEEMLHSVTNYECYKGLYSCLNSKNMFEIAHSFNRQFGEWGLYKNNLLYNFVDNHDVNRIVSMLKNANQRKNVYTLLFTMPGIPSIYYGSEWGISGKKEFHNDHPLRPAIDVDNPAVEDRELQEHIKMLSELRHSSIALKCGAYETLQVTNEQLVFARQCQDETALVFMNIADKSSQLSVSYKGKNYCETIPPCSSKILRD